MSFYVEILNFTLWMQEVQTWELQFPTQTKIIYINNGTSLEKACLFSILSERKTNSVLAKCYFLIVLELTSPVKLIDQIIRYLFSIPLGISLVLHMQMPSIWILSVRTSEYDFLETAVAQHLSVYVTNFFTHGWLSSDEECSCRVPQAVGWNNTARKFFSVK